MKKEELISLGLTDEQRKAVQNLHGLDMDRERKKYAAQLRAEDDEAAIRSAIVKMTFLLNADTLRALLLAASDLYAKETAAPKPETNMRAAFRAAGVAEEK